MVMVNICPKTIFGNWRPCIKCGAVNYNTKPGEIQCKECNLSYIG